MIFGNLRTAVLSTVALTKMVTFIWICIWLECIHLKETHTYTIIVVIQQKKPNVLFKVLRSRHFWDFHPKVFSVWCLMCVKLSKRTCVLAWLWKVESKCGRGKLLIWMVGGSNPCTVLHTTASCQSADKQGTEIQQRPMLELLNYNGRLYLCVAMHLRQISLKT